MRFAFLGRVALLTSLLVSLFSTSALASGHGPVYALATPTLGEGTWSVDVAGMTRVVGSQPDTSVRSMLSYGITSDLQISASVPLPIYAANGGIQPVRMMAFMPATSDAELTLAWRFHRQEPSIGTRFESTAYLAFDYPTVAFQPGAATVPGLTGAIATGYVSRQFYAWLGGLYHRSMTAPVTADHAGDLLMLTAALAYRPPFFRHDEPRPDWRILLEGVGEHLFQDELGGQLLSNTGGTRVSVGPTVLGIYGAWAISGGPMFPVFHSLSGNQPLDRVRFAVNFTYWWF